MIQSGSIAGRSIYDLKYIAQRSFLEGNVSMIKGNKITEKPSYHVNLADYYLVRNMDGLMFDNVSHFRTGCHPPIQVGRYCT